MIDQAGNPDIGERATYQCGELPTDLDSLERNARQREMLLLRQGASFLREALHGS